MSFVYINELIVDSHLVAERQKRPPANPGMHFFDAIMQMIRVARQTLITL